VYIPIRGTYLTIIKVNREKMDERRWKNAREDSSRRIDREGESENPRIRESETERSRRRGSRSLKVSRGRIEKRRNGRRSTLAHSIFEWIPKHLHALIKTFSFPCCQRRRVRVDKYRSSNPERRLVQKESLVNESPRCSVVCSVVCSVGERNRIEIR